MKLPRWLILLPCLVLPLSSAPAVGPVPTTGQRPNLVFVFSDQQSWDMMGCYGNAQVKTPNLDRLAAQGVRFNHCISNAPICTPYRGLLLSGQHPLKSGAFENDVRMLPGEGKYFGEVLRDQGYRMGYYGKWHLYGGNRDRPVPPGPYRYGFDHEFLTNNCTLVYDAERAYYWDDQGIKQGYGDWEPYAQTRQAIEFIEKHAERPFALFLSWHPPHNWGGGHETYAAPEDCLALYDPAILKLRDNVADTPRNRRIYQGHMAMVTSIDRAFGWLMDALRAQRIDDRTIVVFTSDHGDTLHSHGFVHNKMRPEQESVRVPLLVRYPRVLRPRVSELLVGALDLMPTLLGLMRLPVPSTCDGRELAAAILAERDDAVDSVPLFLPPLDFRGVYTRRHTYTFDTSGGATSLYREMFFSKPDGISWNCLFDRETDPSEKNNLFNSPHQPDLRAELHRKTLEWMRKYADQGVPYQTLIGAVISEEDREARRQRNWNAYTGILKGRPHDLLPQAAVPAQTGPASPQTRQP
jgi:arylsulfatase A-like enzyme